MPAYKSGTTLNAKGYLRFTAGPDRGRYVHRAVMAQLCAQFSYYPPTAITSHGRPTGLPSGFTVEHLDHDRTHNCPSNLLLLQTEIHNHLSWCSWLNKPFVGDVEGQSPPIRSPDDYDPAYGGVGRKFTDEEINEVPF